MLAAIVVAFFVFRQWKESPEGSLVWDSLLTRMPLHVVLDPRTAVWGAATFALQTAA